MHVGCKYKIGDIIKGLEIISEPYKIEGKRDYRAMVRCIFCGNEYEAVLSEIKRHIFDGCGCQKNRLNSPRWKSFKTWCIENNLEYLLDLWDYDLNDESPNRVSCRTAKSYYFKCPEGKHPSTLHQIMSLAVTAKEKKNTCTYCNSFAYYCIQKYGDDFLNLYWDYDKNIVDPWNIAPQSNIYIYLKCDIHGTYKVFAPNFYKLGLSCPYCSRERDKSKLQEKTERYIEEKYHLDMTHEYNCSIIAKSPKTGRWLPYDNDIKINNSHLIIEVMGDQHYYVKSGLIRQHAKRNNTSPEDELMEIQWRDEYKKQYALSQGYFYLAIPFWTENDESYKTLIDDKIQSILTTQN